MEGINIEGQDFGTIKTADAINMFFAIESNQEITELRPLLRAANQFCDQNPNVARDAFLNEIREYARVEDFPEGQ